MGQISSKLRRATDAYYWFCPGCEDLHPLPDGWTFDGNTAAPTFTPSFRHTWAKAGAARCCHYIVTAGRVAYCADSTHSLAGKTIDMPDLPPEYRDFENPVEV